MSSFSEPYRRVSRVNKSSTVASYCRRIGSVEFVRHISGTSSRVVGGGDADSDIVINCSFHTSRRLWCADFVELTTTAALGVDSTMACRVFNVLNNLRLG